jgi:hypothetical protein
MREFCKNCLGNMEKIAGLSLINSYRETHWCSNCGTLLILEIRKLTKNKEEWKIPDIKNKS